MHCVALRHILGLARLATWVEPWNQPMVVTVIVIACCPPALPRMMILRPQMESQENTVLRTVRTGGKGPRNHGTSQ